METSTPKGLEALALKRVEAKKYDKKAARDDQIKINGRQPENVIADIIALYRRGGEFTGSFANDAAMDTLIGRSVSRYLGYYGASTLLATLFDEGLLKKSTLPDAYYWASHRGGVDTMQKLQRRYGLGFTGDGKTFISHLTTNAAQNAAEYMIEHNDMEAIIKHAVEVDYWRTFDGEVGSIVSDLSRKGYIRAVHLFLNSIDPFGLNGKEKAS